MSHFDKTILGLPHSSKHTPESERPRCQCCGKPLKLAHSMGIYMLEDGKVLDTLPRAGDTEETMVEKALKKVQKSVAWRRTGPRFNPFTQQQVTLVNLWDGSYTGVGEDENGVPIFCKKDCATKFGLVMYESGKRIRNRGELLTRK